MGKKKKPKQEVVAYGMSIHFGVCAGPVEYMWGHLKTHEIANLIATKAWELSLEATAALRRMRRRRLIIAACYTQAELWP